MHMEISSLIALLIGMVLLFYCIRVMIRLSLSFLLFLLALTVGGLLSFFLLPTVRSILSSFRSA